MDIFIFSELGDSARVEWNYIDAHQIEFLHSLFHGDWNFIGQYTRHTAKEAFEFWKQCKCGISDNAHRYFKDKEREGLSGDAITTYWEQARQKILLSDNDVKLVSAIKTSITIVVHF